MAKYSKFLKMRVSPEDIEIMIKKAETLKISRSDFVRQAIRNSNVYALPSEDIRKFTWQQSARNQQQPTGESLAFRYGIPHSNKGKLKSVNLEKTQEAIQKVSEELNALRIAIEEKNN